MPFMCQVYYELIRITALIIGEETINGSGETITEAKAHGCSTNLSTNIEEIDNDTVHVWIHGKFSRYKEN